MLTLPRGMFTYERAGMQHLTEKRKERVHDVSQTWLCCSPRAYEIRQNAVLMVPAAIKYLFHALCRAPFAHYVEQSAKLTCWRLSCLKDQRGFVQSPRLLFPGFRGLVRSLEGD